MDAIVSALPDVRTATPVSSVRRQPGGGGGGGGGGGCVEIVTPDGRVEKYEDVIMACHSDQAMRLMGGNASEVVPGRYCSTRHSMPFDSVNESSKSVSMTW